MHTDSIHIIIILRLYNVYISKLQICILTSTCLDSQSPCLCSSVVVPTVASHFPNTGTPSNGQICSETINNNTNGALHNIIDPFQMSTHPVKGDAYMQACT